MERPLCKLQTVGNQSFWFCMECAEEGPHPGDPSWMELSETGASGFFSTELEEVLRHLEEAHGFKKNEIRVEEETIVLK